jgi:hypothetical protein
MPEPFAQAGAALGVLDFELYKRPAELGAAVRGERGDFFHPWEIHLSEMAG